MGEAAYRMYEQEGKHKSKPLPFRCDTAKLKQWLTKRKASLDQVRQEFEPLWKEIRLYFEPNIGKALIDAKERDAVVSRREDGKIINSEPRQCVHRYGAGMQSGITNKAQGWCRIVPKGISEEASLDSDLNVWCSTATTEILSALERANFYRTSNQVYVHGALFGTSCVLVLRGKEPGDIYFSLIDEGDYWIAEDKFGEVTVLMRRINMTIGQAAEEFLVGNLPTQWKDKYDNGKLEERVEVWNMICPNDGSDKFKDVDESRPWVSIYWTQDSSSSDAESNGILEVSSYSYKPMAVLRQIDSGSVYGKGIGEMSLPDNKELQKLEEYLHKMVAYEVMPPMAAPSSMKGRPINMFPGGVTFYDGILQAGASPIQRMFELREGIDKVDAKIQMITERIGRFWYNDLFAMMLQINAGNRAQKTATEVSELSGEKVTLLGPVLTQMDEFLTNIIDAVFTILLEDGIISTPPPALTEGTADVAVEYTSTIHAEMKAALKMRAINVLIEMASMLAQAKPNALEKINEDKIIDEVCRVYPGAASFIYNSREVERIREAKTAKEQQMVADAQYVEMMKTAGQNVKSLSEAHLGNGSALDAVMAGIGGM